MAQRRRRTGAALNGKTAAADLQPRLFEKRARARMPTRLGAGAAARRCTFKYNRYAALSLCLRIGFIRKPLRTFSVRCSSLKLGALDQSYDQQNDDRADQG